MVLAEILSEIGSIFMVSVTIALTAFIILLIEIIIWIRTLVHQAKRKRWVWFVFTLIFHIIWVLYWIVCLFSKEFRKGKRK